MSRVPIEPNNLPSSPAFDAIVTSASSVNLTARASAAVKVSANLASNSARRASKCSTLAEDANTALPFGNK
jgi:hypothetical protein